MKTSLAILVVIIIGILLGSTVNYFTYKLHAQKIRCSMFTSQADAQAHYRPALDRNHNDIACETYHYGK